MLKYIEILRFYVNDRKRHFLSLPRQQENPQLSVKTVSEKQNSEVDLGLELLETIMSV